MPTTTKLQDCHDIYTYIHTYIYIYMYFRIKGYNPGENGDDVLTNVFENREVIHSSRVRLFLGFDTLGLYNHVMSCLLWCSEEANIGLIHICLMMVLVL